MRSHPRPMRDPAEVWRRMFLAGCLVVFAAVLIVVWAGGAH